jgi:hypothetical protein
MSERRHEVSFDGYRAIMSMGGGGWIESPPDWWPVTELVEAGLVFMDRRTGSVRLTIIGMILESKMRDKR